MDYPILEIIGSKMSTLLIPSFDKSLNGFNVSTLDSNLQIEISGTRTGDTYNKTNHKCSLSTCKSLSH